MNSSTIEDIMGVDRNALIKIWLDLFNEPIPRSISMQLMRRMIIFELQIRKNGGLSASVKRRLSTLSKPQSKTDVRSFGQGSRLIREWNGVTHVVEVTEDGYRWKGKTHKSLSAIARAITGARWSGPRFFGTNTGA